MTRPRLAIVGATSWGCTLATALDGVSAVTILARTPAEALDLASSRRIPRLAVDARIPPGVTITADPAEALATADAVVLAVPSQTMRRNLQGLRDHLPAGVPLVSAAKGLEAESTLRMSEVIHAEAPDHPVLVLSGPNLAAEIALGLPATAVLACADETIAEAVRPALMTPRFRVYVQGDVLGVEICGALKNVVAIGAGIADGKGYGQNAKAAFVARGLAEMARLGVALGAQPLTFLGLAGLGDLWATCSSPYSRNRSFGERLGRGESVASALAATRNVTEAVPTTRAAWMLARQAGVEMPIVTQAYRVLFDGLDVETALLELMVRDARHEFDGLPFG